MSVLYIAVPVALSLGAAALAAFIWSVRNGQLDDLDTPPVRVLFDDEPIQADANGRKPLIEKNDPQL